ncbi:unnamed protein product, partial [Linum tenue]
MSKLYHIRCSILCHGHGLSVCLILCSIPMSSSPFP